MFMHWPGSNTNGSVGGGGFDWLAAGFGPGAGRLGFTGPSGVPNVKPYQYRVPQNGTLDGMINYFGQGPSPNQGARDRVISVNGSSAHLETCQPPGSPSYICLFVGGRELQPNDLLNVPGDWPDPTDTSRLTCIGGGTPPTCGAIPPGPTPCAAGQYPYGAGGGCIPPPFPIPNPPGTCPPELYTADGQCWPSPPFPVPVPPGTCPTGLYMSSDGTTCLAACPPGQAPDSNRKCAVTAPVTAGVGGGGAAILAVLLAVGAGILALSSEEPQVKR